MRAPPIGSVVVAGGGIAGWSAAAALKRRIPRLSVTIVPTAPTSDALIDRVGSTLPSIVEFHHDIGLTEADTVLRIRSGFRLGSRFQGWTGARSSYVHAYGEYGRPFGTASFHQHWIRCARQGRAAPFDAHAPGAAIGGSNRFVHPSGGDGSPLAAFGYGLQIDPAAYRAMMRAYALHLGVTERGTGIRGVRLRGSDGFVEGLQLEDGGEARADLFVDATGPAALVRGALDEAFEDWSRWFGCDRLLLAEAPPRHELASLDTVAAETAGWRWEATSPVRSAHGLAYASRHLSDEEAAQSLGTASGAEPGNPVPFRPGRRPEPWRRNCVAIGEAAMTVEPLEWTGLHLAHSAIDRIVSMMPDCDCSEVELWDYNRQTAAEAERVRDFLLLHYVASRREEPFWREAAAVELPASLAHTLSLFRERGRLPFYEEETFSRDSWLAVLLGQDVIPRRSDPLIDTVPAEESERAMAQMREGLDALAQTLPTQSDYLQNLSKQAAR